MKNQVKKLVGIAALSAAMTIGAAGGIAYSHMTHADLVKAETANYYAEESHVFSGTGTLTQTKSETFTLTGVKAGQYSVTVEITKTEGESQEWFYLSATGLDDAVFLNESTESVGKYYGVVNVGAGGTLTISSTSPNTLYVNVTLDNLFMSEDSGYSLGNVHFAKSFSPISIDFSGTNVSDFTVQVDLGDRLLKDGETLTARIGDVTKPLVAQTDNLAIYSATLTETDVTEKKLTITSTIVEAEDESVVGSVTLLPLSNVYTMTTNTATAENVPVWETAIFSYTPQAEGTEEEPIKTFYKSVAISTAEGVSIETDTTVSLTAGTFNGTTIVDENYPVYVEAGTTYYFEVTLTGITPGTLENADITITLSDWVRPTIEVGKTYALPVTPATETAHEEFTLQAAEGKYNLTITDVPFNYYWAETPIVITAHIGTQAIALTRENNYSAEVDITAGDKVYFTTSENARTTLTFSFEVYQEVHYIVPGAETEIKVPANGSVIYNIQAAVSGIYSITLVDTTMAISVYGEDKNVAIIPAGENAGGFVVRYDGVDYGIEFRNSSDADVTIKATVSLDSTATLQLGAENELSLTAGQRRSYFMYSLAAGTFNLTVNPSANLTLTVDGEAVDISSGTATLTITREQEDNGIVNFTFENTSADKVDFKVTVTPSISSTVKVGETITINTVDYEYRVTYYAMVTANESYALTLDVPEGMSVIVNQNGENLIYYDGHVGAFTAQSTGYVALSFICYTYGNITELKAHFIASSAMPINTEITVDTAEMSTYVAYLYPGTYHIDVDNENVKIAINSVEITGNSFEVYVYGGVTITFIYDGEGTFNATLVPSNILTVGETKEITLTPYDNITYYINLSEGAYSITLTLEDGSQVQVMLNGSQVIAAGGSYYEFEISSNGYYALTFNNIAVTDVTFSVVVTVLE